MVAGGWSSFVDGEDVEASGSGLVEDEDCWGDSGLGWPSLCEILRFLLGGMLMSFRCEDQANS